MHQIVPLASHVAVDLHQIVPAAGPAADALACRHGGGGPCPALAPLFGPLTPTGEEAAAWVQGLAPCSLCRVASEAGRDRLRRLRLGQREREILIGAANGGAFTVTEPGMSRSLSAARRRAALSLSRAGLTAPQAPGRTQRATIALTELGHYVMAAYGRYITTGRPVRWTRPARGAALPGRDPATLCDVALANTQAALRGTLGELKGVLLAAISGRFKDDPEHLDATARRLERKATLLKAVLQPAEAARK